MTAPAESQSICGECHAAIAQSYSATGMGRSFSRPAPSNRIEKYSGSAFYHAPSDTYFEMVERNGEYFQRQYQFGFRGQRTNESETAIDYIMGSGNHARTYLHRRPDNELIELPLGWYAEKGGYWSMNPGYDRPDHAGLSRSIPYACMFCHNGYPEIPEARGPRANPVFRNIPEGIDCQRCHGDGREHVRLAQASGSRLEAVRAAIVNPSRLTSDRQLEVCLQCHLEPNGGSLSNLMVRYERAPFSYKPGEPLAGFRLHFDQPATASDRFEIVGSAAYRLMQSQCFLKSKGAMTCTTCHDPHSQVQHQNEACMKCHANTVVHSADPDCIGCHMPKRRAQDAVHVVMTDHLIQRKKPDRDLLGPLAEELHSDNAGKVEPYYPPDVSNLYLGIAQVSERSSRVEGIARLRTAITNSKPSAAEYYLQLGDALRASRRFSDAIEPYEEAVRREPQSAIAHLRLGLDLARARQFGRADEQYKAAERLAPADASLFKDIGISYLEQGRMADAGAAFGRSIALDPAQYEAHNGLGGVHMKTGDPVHAESEFRAAIVLRPHYSEAHHNLAYLLSVAGRPDEAEYHFKESLHINAANVEARFDYAAMLSRLNRAAEARVELQKVLSQDPNHSKARDLLNKLR